VLLEKVKAPTPIITDHKDVSPEALYVFDLLLPAFLREYLINIAYCFQHGTSILIVEKC